MRRTCAKDLCEGPVRRIGRVHIWELGLSGNLVVVLYRFPFMARGMFRNVIGGSGSRPGPRLLHSPTRFLSDSAQGHRGAEGKSRNASLRTHRFLSPHPGLFSIRELHPRAHAVRYRVSVLRTFPIASCSPSPVLVSITNPRSPTLPPRPANRSPRVRVRVRPPPRLCASAGHLAPQKTANLKLPTETLEVPKS